jgi:hypothetical protein
VLHIWVVPLPPIERPGRARVSIHTVLNVLRQNCLRRFADLLPSCTPCRRELGPFGASLPLVGQSSRRLILVLTRATRLRDARARDFRRSRDRASGGTSRLRRLAPLGDHTTGQLTGCSLGEERLLLTVVGKLGRSSLRATGGGPQGCPGSGQLPGSNVRVDPKGIDAYTHRAHALVESARREAGTPEQPLRGSRAL